jgi:hypothetical protein
MAWEQKGNKPIAVNHLPRIGFCCGRSDQQQSTAPVLDWKNQAIEILNEPGWRVADIGPLHGDIGTFKIRRDQALTLFIDTEAVRGRSFPGRQVRPGTARINSDKVLVESSSGAKAVLSGVDARTRVESGNTVRENGRVHELTIALPKAGPAAHTIEWVENLPSHHIWPNIIESVEGSKASIAFTDKRVTVVDPEAKLGTGRQAAILNIAGHRLCIWGPRAVIEGPTPRSGRIIYEGVPDELTRKKFRTALSFAFGTYLVETGHTIFDKDWHALSATARSAYSLGGRASELSIQPLMWLSDRNADFDIGLVSLTRMVERLFAAYDALDLANLSWAYWHARTAPPHIAPAHFGSAIEALQRSYGKLHTGAIQTRILADAKWTELLEAFSYVFAKAHISGEDTAVLTEQIKSGVNYVPKRDQLKAFADLLKIKLGKDEDTAWKRRNKSAHGIPIKEGKELEAIRDTQLLMVLFHRMFLATTGAADFYLDYCSPGIPRRLLREPVPSPSKPTAK